MFTDFPQLNEYFDNLQQSKSKHTVRSYEKAIVDFLEYCSVASLEDLKKVDAKQVRNYQSFLLEKGIKASSINTIIRPVSVFFHWLWRNEYIQDILMDKVQQLKEPKREPVFLTEEEINSIINSCGDDLQTKTMLIFMLSLGLRRFEVTNIKLEDIKDKEYLLVHGKGNREDVLPLNSRVKEILSQYMRKHRKESEYLFFRKRGGGKISEQTVYDRLKSACQKAGISIERINKITPHVLRHSTASNLLANGVDPVTVQSILRHSSFNTTLRYLHVMDNGKKNAVETLVKGLGD